jgi:hypothetical protein
MAAELPRPGVEVIQVFRTVSPTVVTPTLVPCVVGVCKQVLDLYTKSAAGANQLNSSVLTAVPATLTATPATGSPPAYTGLDGLDLVLSFNNGPDVTVTFVDASALGLTPASVAAQINDALALESITEAIAGYTADTDSLYLRTVGTGDTQTIEVMPGTDVAVLSAFGGADPGLLGWAIGRIATGVSGYSDSKFYLPYFNLPDPNGNLSEITIEPDTIRVFLSQGGSISNIKELSRTQTHLRHGAGASAAKLTGSIDLTTLTYGSGGDLDGKTLLVKLNGATAVTVTLGIAALAPADDADLVCQINNDLGKNIASVVADHLVLTSQTTGVLSTVEVTSGTAQTVLGFAAPNNIATGVASVVAVDDGDGDVVTPLISCTGEDFTAAETAATVLGILDLSAPGALIALVGKSLTLSVDGSPTQTMVLGTYITVAALITAVETFFGNTVLNLTGTTAVTFTSLSEGASSSLTFAGDALPLLGIVPKADATISAATWRDPGTATTPYYDLVVGKKLRVSVGGTTVEHTFTGAFVTFADIVTEINANTAFSAVAVASAATAGILRIASKTGGPSAYVEILAATSAESNYLFGWKTGDIFTGYTFYGTGHAPISGDDLYVDGVLVGRILKAAPSGEVDQVKLDKEVTVTTDYGDSFYMIAKKLPRTSPTTGPTPDLAVDGYGNVSVGPFVMRDTLGVPTLGVSSSIYSTYRAIRKDVTALANQPGLLRIDSTTQLEDSIPPLTAENPLALGMYFALLNAPTCQITGLGVDAVSADAPYGTVEAFTRAAEFLEAYEVYAISPLTHDETVGQVFGTHVSVMSEPENKGERICLFNWAMPTRAVDTLIASGEGDGIGTGSSQFNTKVSNLGTLLLANGVNPVGTIATSAGVFLDIYSDDKHYSVQSVAGGTVTLRTTFGPGENDDSFYATAVPAGLLVDEVFSVRVRGAELLTAGLPDKQKTAETLQTMGLGSSNRRFWNIVPDKCASTVGGVEQQLEGFYMCAAVAGMIGQQPPQQSFTNFPMTGFTKVIGSNDYFTNKQLNVIAAGGNYVIVQDARGVPLTSRMALTTDMTSVETRTDSINKIVDYTAKFMRVGLKNFIGRFNITSSFIDTLSHVSQGLLGFLQDTGVLVGSTLNNIVQDENSPDTVLIDITLDVPYPCNYIRLVLMI